MGYAQTIPGKTSYVLVPKDTAKKSIVHTNLIIQKVTYNSTFRGYDTYDIAFEEATKMGLIVDADVSIMKRKEKAKTIYHEKK